MQANELKPARGSKRTPKRLGRGNASGKGTTAGKGTKGQRARTGGRAGLKRLGFKLILQRIPKVRGFKKPSIGVFAFSLDRVAQNFENNSSVSLKSLKKAGLVPPWATKIKLMGISGGSGINKKFTIVGCKVTEGARKAIEAAGGRLE